MISVPSNLGSTLLAQISLDDLDAVASKITFPNGSRVIVIGVYRHPRSSPNFTHHLETFIARFNIDCPVIITGDFNFPEINWRDNTSSEPKSFDFVGLCNTLGLSQHVNFPTRGYNILDLILCNDRSLIFNVKPGIQISDHVSVECSLNIPLSPSCDNVEKTYFDYRNGDYAAMCHDLAAIDWVSQFGQCTDIDQKYNVLTCYIHDSINIRVPILTIKSAKKFPSWLLSKKLKIRKLFDKQKHTKDPDDIYTYKNATKLYKQDVKSYLIERERSILKKGSPAEYWNYIKKRTVGKADIPFLSDGKNLVSDDFERAQMFNKHFSDVFIRDDHKPFSAQSKTSVSLMNINLDPDRVYTYLKHFKRKLSYGPDNIPSIVLQSLAVVLAEPLSMIFKESLTTGNMPNLWKQSIVVPVHKKDDPSIVNNYRPISLTCTSCRVLERMLVYEMRTHLWSNHLVAPQQFGFLDGRSTISQMVEYVSFISSELGAKRIVDSIYLDVAKAFDTVSHRRLIQICDAYGFRGNLLRWLQNYLTGRTQCVRISNKLSDWLDVLSGVPQGSVVGPLMFLLYVNDIGDVIEHSKFHIYADDLKLYLSSSTPCFESKLISDLRRIAKFFIDRQMKLSVSKCECMHFGKNNPMYSYTCEGQPLRSVRNIRDLGIQLNFDLSPDSHISKQVRKASALAILVPRTFSYSKDLYRNFFIYKIRPILEYGSEVLCLMNKTFTNALEKTQRKFTKAIFPKMSYANRLESLQLETLYMRRMKSNLTLVHSYMYGYIKSENPFDVIDSKSRSSRNRSNGYKLYSNAKNTIQQSFIIHSVVNTWNLLPQTVVNIPDKHQFRKSLNNHINFHSKNGTIFSSLKIQDPTNL